MLLRDLNGGGVEVKLAELNGCCCYVCGSVGGACDSYGRSQSYAST